MKTTIRFYSCRNYVFAALFLLSVSLLSCKGPEGPMGPQGEKGDTGNDGAPGIANISSVQYTVPPSSWTGNADGYTAILTVPEITSDIFNNGAVLVYMLNEQDPNNEYFNMLPYTYVDNSSTEYMDFNVYIGQINLMLKWTDNGVNTTQAPAGTEFFKIIIEQGTPLSTLKQNVNVANYNAVVKFLGITESNTKLK